MDDSEITKAQPVPPHETTPSPVEVSTAMPHYFGLTPPTLLFGVATATLAVAIVLAVLQHWVAALVLAAVVLVEIVLFAGVVRRKPDTRAAAASVTAARRLRERTRWAVESMNVRSDAGRRITRLRHELLELGGRRERGLRELGAAVYARDEAAAGQATEELRTIDGEMQAKQTQMRAISDEAEERLQHGRLGVQPTEIRGPADGE
jgi:type IV secretory pathway VirB3-like protein